MNIDNAVFVCHLTPKQRNALVQLIGRKCTILCSLNNVKVDALWDTGAQVSVMSREFLEHNFPLLNIRDISELIGLETLDLRTANGTKLPFAGWVEIDFVLSCTNNKMTQLKVPFLVSNYSLELPINHRVQCHRANSFKSRRRLRCQGDVTYVILGEF